MKFPSRRDRMFELACLSVFSEDRVASLPYGMWQLAERRQHLGSN
jgi:hypothetical protein